MTDHQLSETIDIEKYTAFIFDLDGVVTKTARVHATSWKRLFDQYLERRAKAVEQPFQPFDSQIDYRTYVDGKPRYEGVKSFLQSRDIALPYGDASDEADAETVCGLGNRKDEYFQQILKEEGVEVFHSTVALIREVKSRDRKVAIASSSKNCMAVLHAAGLSELFDAKVDGVDLAREQLKGKPAPDMFLRAAALLGVHPKDAAVFEDALVGVEAGKKGGFGLVVGVDRVGQAESLRRHGADMVVTDLAELSFQALPSALTALEEFVRLGENKRLVVFLDYDGTLTPIVSRPELAVLSAAMRNTIMTLAEQVTVAIISGRDRPDVERLVKLENLFYAGSHGFDIAGPHGFHVRHEIGAHFLPALDRAEGIIRERLASVRGSLIERKKYSIAVHYRLVHVNDVEMVRQAVLAVLSRVPELRKRDGKKVFEMQPDIDWDKGKAVLWLLQAMNLKKSSVLPVFIGDDLTDEDAFRALQDFGIGIVVMDQPRPTVARYILKDSEEVGHFLARLSGALEVREL